MLRVGTRKAEFIVVCATDSRALEERRFSVLYGVFGGCGSDHWEFINPATFVGYFLRSDNGEIRARELVATLTELMRLMPDYSTLGIGQSSGELVARFTWRGKLRTAPKGVAVEEAIRLAARRQGTSPAAASTS